MTKEQTSSACLAEYERIAREVNREMPGVDLVLRRFEAMKRCKFPANSLYMTEALRRCHD